MANIHDIARLSGYSTATVSRVINGHRYVSAAARARILTVMKQLDYVPSTMAQNLSAGKTGQSVSFYLIPIIPILNNW